MGRILVVEDDANARRALVDILESQGHEVAAAEDGVSGLKGVTEFSPALLLTDVKMPRLDGLGLLAELRSSEHAHIGVVLMTGFGEIDAAVRAMRDGAMDYLLKPLAPERLLLVVENALELLRLRRDVAAQRERLGRPLGFDQLIGNSSEMHQVYKCVEQVAPSRVTVLIRGPSGTGKELVARAIHQRSTRANGPFVRLNCAALAETLLESELFGHERGAFTGAERRREGRFEQADGGTLFLDEVGDVPMPTQVKLLRFLQEREFERVGGNAPIRSDVRVIAATNRNLEEMLSARTFRSDLYYRLNVVDLRIPPLAERKSDIPSLALHFLRRCAEENESAVTGFSDEALQLLVSHSWPGNVRELENAIERAVVLAGGPIVCARDLPLEIAGRTSRLDIPGSTLEQIERYMILASVEACGGSTPRAAEMLGISVRKIQYRLREYTGMQPTSVPVLNRDSD